eukprot:gene22327-28448_t
MTKTSSSDIRSKSPDTFGRDTVDSARYVPKVRDYNASDEQIPTFQSDRSVEKERNTSDKKNENRSHRTTSSDKSERDFVKSRGGDREKDRDRSERSSHSRDRKPSSKYVPKERDNASSSSKHKSAESSSRDKESTAAPSDRRGKDSDREHRDRGERAADEKISREKDRERDRDKDRDRDGPRGDSKRDGDRPPPPRDDYRGGARERDRDSSRERPPRDAVGDRDRDRPAPPRNIAPSLSAVSAPSSHYSGNNSSYNGSRFNNGGSKPPFKSDMMCKFDGFPGGCRFKSTCRFRHLSEQQLPPPPQHPMEIAPQLAPQLGRDAFEYSNQYYHKSSGDRKSEGTGVNESKVKLESDYRHSNDSTTLTAPDSKIETDSKHSNSRSSPSKRSRKEPATVEPPAVVVEEVVVPWALEMKNILVCRRLAGPELFSQIQQLRYPNATHFGVTPSAEGVVADASNDFDFLFASIAESQSLYESSHANNDTNDNNTENEANSSDVNDLLSSLENTNDVNNNDGIDDLLNDIITTTSISDQQVEEDTAQEKKVEDEMNTDEVSVPEEVPVVDVEVSPQVEVEEEENEVDDMYGDLLMSEGGGGEGESDDLYGDLSAGMDQSYTEEDSSHVQISHETTTEEVAILSNTNIEDEPAVAADEPFSSIDDLLASCGNDNNGNTTSNTSEVVVASTKAKVRVKLSREDPPKLRDIPYVLQDLSYARTALYSQALKGQSFGSTFLQALPQICRLFDEV